MFTLTIVLVTIAYGTAVNAWSVDVRYAVLLYIPVGVAAYFLATVMWPIVGSSRQLAKRMQDHWRALLHPLEAKFAGEIVTNQFFDTQESEDFDGDANDRELSSSSTGANPKVFAILNSIANLLMLLLVLSIMGRIVSDSTGLSMRIVSLAVFTIVVGVAVLTFIRRNQALRD